MTSRIEKYIKRRKTVLDETLSEIDSLRDRVCGRENRRIEQARRLQRNIEETMKLNDEELRLKSCRERAGCDSDLAYRVAEEVLNSWFKIKNSRGYKDCPWCPNTEYLISPGLYARTTFEDESRPTIEEQGLREVAGLMIAIPINWKGQIERRKMKQSLYRALTSNKSPWSMAEELLEKMKKIYFTQLAKIDRKYKEQTNLGMKIDEQSLRDCHEAKVRTLNRLGIDWYF